MKTSTNTNGDITITVPMALVAVVIDGISHPQADGTNGQVLQTNGSGQLSCNSFIVSPFKLLCFITLVVATLRCPQELQQFISKPLVAAVENGTRGPGNGNSAYGGSAGGDSTVTLATPSIAITAKKQLSRR